MEKEIKKEEEIFNIVVENDKVNTFEITNKEGVKTLRGSFEINSVETVYVSAKFIHETKTGRTSIGILPSWKYFVKNLKTGNTEEVLGSWLVKTYLDNK